MAVRHLTLILPINDKDTFQSLAKEPDILEIWTQGKPRGRRQEVNILVESDKVQAITDHLQRRFHKEKDWRIIISPIETTIPRPEDSKTEEDEPKAKKSYGSMTREALYDQILKGTRTSRDFLILVFLSTIVTAIGLITNNLAVIIGAMVIAPLLGPNLALSFGVTLGDRLIMREAFRANAFGFSMTLALAVMVGLVIPYEIYADSPEYLLRTTVGYDSILLALASGAAAVLSLTSGISSAMVGVMVAVALMPPAVTFGLAVGAGAWEHSYGAALLLAINIICVNLAAQSVFSLKGIRPRTWYMRKKTRQSLKLSLIFWTLLLLVLITLISVWQA